MKPIDAINDFVEKCLIPAVQVRPDLFLTIHVGERYRWPIYLKALKSRIHLWSCLPVTIPQNMIVDVKALFDSNSLTASDGWLFDEGGDIRYTSFLP